MQLNVKPELMYDKHTKGDNNNKQRATIFKLSSLYGMFEDFLRLYSHALSFFDFLTDILNLKLETEQIFLEMKLLNSK